MTRRTIAALLCGLALFLLSTPSWAGSYLNRAALLLNGSASERAMVQPRSTDKELLRVVYEVAQARSRAARQMQVPKVVVQAHPHLLLVMENTERAYEAALAGKFRKFMTYLSRARSEDATFRAIIEKLGYGVPRT